MVCGVTVLAEPYASGTIPWKPSVDGLEFFPWLLMAGKGCAGKGKNLNGQGLDLLLKVFYGY